MGAGADVAKALALGAKMVLIGRPYAYGLAIAGEAGVSHVLRSILADLDLTLHLGGIKSVSQLGSLYGSYRQGRGRCF